MHVLIKTLSVVLTREWHFFFVIFCFSGEKTPTNEWPSSLEIKGRVRLDAFEKFLQELPMSRSRAVMVSYDFLSFTVASLLFHTSGCSLLQIVCRFSLFFDDFHCLLRMYIPKYSHFNQMVSEHWSFPRFQLFIMYWMICFFSYAVVGMTWVE